VSFRQKQDNTDDWIEGFAERAEFDDSTDVLKLYNQARVKRNTDELRGQFISYDMRKELALVSGAPENPASPGVPQKSTSQPPRVKMILTPPKKEPEADKDKPAAKPAGIELKTDAGKQ
jgi:lipopolysaccharide export system protein LptA